VTAVAAPATISTADLTGPRVVRFEDLVPRWTQAKSSSEPGFLRWLAPYVGGPPGHLHDDADLVGKHSIMGIMGLPAGQRQWGLHRHTTCEIYLILKGHVESLEAERVTRKMGPMDLLYIPIDAPHAVRTVGDEDVLLLFVHDEHEQIGASRYFADDDPSHLGPDIHPSIVKWDQLEPWWGAPRAKEAGHLRWSVSWVGGPDGKLNLNRGRAVESDISAFGATVITAANSEVEERWETVRYIQVVKGRVRVDGHPELGDLHELDVLVVPSGHPHALRPVGTDPATIVWFHEDNDLPLAG
jgi:quercetin dioxygenase-like cupin family protein